VLEYRAPAKPAAAQSVRKRNAMPPKIAAAR
jgi:hypothetical protein